MEENEEKPFDQPETEMPESPEPESVTDNFEPSENFFDRFAEKLASSIAEAEERGYKRALELLKASQRDAMERDRSVPNFLSDVRRDIWEGE